MGKQTGISWTDHTFNPWRGCTKVSAGCANCYAETWSKRNPAVLGKWGANGTRVVAAESGWREPLKWDKEAKAAGERRRVFCASLADIGEDWQGPMTNAAGQPLWVADVEPGRWLSWPAGGLDGMLPIERQNVEQGVYRPLTMADVRMRLWDTINATTNLDYLMLTKRIENARRMLPDRWFDIAWPANVWLGVTVENQAAADARIPHLLKIPAAVRFLSVEPMLGPVDLTGWLGWSGERMTAGGPMVWAADRPDWVIVGGESGPGARWCDIAWIRDVVRQCEAAGVACFVKQLGANALDTTPPAAGWSSTCDFDRCVHLRHPAGADPAEWPEDLRVQEFPVIKGE